MGRYMLWQPLLAFMLLANFIRRLGIIFFFGGSCDHLSKNK